MDEDIIIVGAGIAGVSSALALHRYGIRSVVLESSETLGMTGFALTVWANAWKALGALGVEDVLRAKSLLIQGPAAVARSSSMAASSDQNAPAPNANNKLECRCVKRKDLLETLEGELPEGVIRYSSKIVAIEESGNLKLVHLSDGSVLRTKVLIGCDGGNSVVAKWLGLQSPISYGRSAIRGLSTHPDGHAFEPKFLSYVSGDVLCGFVPCDNNSIFWFFNFSPSLLKFDENEKSSIQLKELVLSTLSNAPTHILDVIEKTELDSICCTPLKYRTPWNILTSDIVRDNVCVAGDALHPMTPYIGQGGCSSLEDSVVLARCLAESLLVKPDSGEEESTKIARGLKNYEKARRWRSFGLLSAAYAVGLIEGCGAGKVMRFLKKLFLIKFIAGIRFRVSDYDCGKLVGS